VQQIFRGSGVLSYRKKNWATIWIDDEIARYYRSTIRTPGQHKNVQRPLYRSHITLVNGRHEPQAQHSPFWGKYEGEKIRFTYTGEVHFVRGKWFIKCRCKRMGDIREELGLSRIFAIRPPHITIARITDTPARIGNTSNE